MKFNMTSPCNDCPFVKGSATNTTLRQGRIEGIVRDLRAGMTFQCHKTLNFKRDKHEHCAGAMLYLERENSPNQMMRIAERLGLYDHRKFKQCDSLIDPL